MVTRLLEQAENPESNKLKTGGLLAMMNDCVRAGAPEEMHSSCMARLLLPRL